MFIENFYFEPTEDPTKINFTYRIGSHIYKGILTRELTEVEKLRQRVAELENLLAPDLQDDLDLSSDIHEAE